MTRLEMLTILIGQARTNGFEFRRWYKERLGLPWINADAALKLLESQRRYYALLFSHEFASAFWKAGENITFKVEAQSFQRVMPDGSSATIKRKPFTRRSARRDAWKYHLREMALADEPLRYMRRYLSVEDELEDDAAAAPETAKPSSPKKAPGPASRKPRPLPTGAPAFLKRPYK